MEMSNKPDQATKVFSMQAADLYDFFEEAENHVMFGKELISYYLEEGGDYLIGNLPHSNHSLAPLAKAH